jgi:hypothetical protein
LDSDRLSDVLSNWKSWLRRSNVNIGFPPKSSPFESGGVVSSESRDGLTLNEAYAHIDDEEARITDTVINDLPPAQRDAVSNVVMGTRRPLGEPLEVVYGRARAQLMVRLPRRGVE